MTNNADARAHKAGIHIHKNMSLRDAIAAAEQIGFRIRLGKGGELVFAHDLANRLLRVDSHSRSSVPASLLALMRRVMERISA